MVCCRLINPRTRLCSMSRDERSILNARLFAAAELGVRVVAPFRFSDANGLPIEFIALFSEFGSPKGIAVCYFPDGPAKHVDAKHHGYYCSGLHPGSYSRYDSNFFAETFEEWGWQGSPS